MKTVFKTSLALCLLVLFFSVAGVIATAAQTCNPNIKETTPTDRFIIDDVNGTVTDTKTGLMWKKCSEGQIGANCTGGAVAYTWQGALQQAQVVNSGVGFAGFTDWRVPNINELHSIVERKCYDPAINLSVFPNTPSGRYWSSSPVAYGGSNAWFVNFYYGGDDWSDKDGNVCVRLVRSGQ